MYAKSFVAASALLSVAAAVPLNNQKRELVWVTDTKVDIVTVPMTTTIWVDATDAPVANAHYGHGHHHWPRPSSSAESSAESTSVAPSSSETYVAPSSSSSSVYVAPTTSSTSEYVAPTTSSTSESSTYVAPSSTYVAPTSTYVAPTSTYVAPTSTYVAPTSTYVAPTSTYVAPTSTYVAPSSTSAAAPATSSASSSSGSGLTSGPAKSGTSYTGDMTYYATGLGACGWDNTISDHIVAVSEDLFDSYDADEGEGGSNSNPVCGKMVTITGVDGTDYPAKVVDRCTGCAMSDLDLSEDFFNLVTSNGDGRVSGVSWVFQ